MSKSIPINLTKGIPGLLPVPLCVGTEYSFVNIDRPAPTLSTVDGETINGGWFPEVYAKVINPKEMAVFKVIMTHVLSDDKMTLETVFMGYKRYAAKTIYEETHEDHNGNPVDLSELAGKFTMIQDIDKLVQGAFTLIPL